MGIAAVESFVVSGRPTDNLDALLRAAIFQPLANLRRRARLYMVLDGAVIVYLALLGGGLLQLLLDWGLKLSVDQRIVLSAAAAGFWGWMSYRRLYVPMIREVRDRTLATAVDRAHPELHDQVAAAVQFARGEVGPSAANSPRLVRAVLEEACHAVSDLSFTAILNHHQARRRAGELAGLLLATLLAAMVIPGLAGTWLQRNWLLRDIPWPQQTYITPIGFEDGRRRVPRGDELEIAATNSGRQPATVELVWRTAAGGKGSEPMTRVGANRWEVSLGVLNEDISFRIVGGDERTREYTVQAVERPRVITTSVRIIPPSYTRLEPVELEQQTVLDVPQGSTIELAAEFNRQVESVRLVGGAGAVGECLSQGPARVRVHWEAPVSGSYYFELVDRDGWTNQRPVRFTVNVIPDAPPTVSLTSPEVGRHITPMAEVPVELMLADAYGLSGATLLVGRGEDPGLQVPLAGFESGRREFEVETLLDITLLRVKPGERVRIWAEARDGDPVGPNVGCSKTLELEIVTPSDFLAELAGRELGLRREFERLISTQRGLTDALRRLLPTLPEQGPAPVGPAQRLAELASRQDADAQHCLRISRRFEQILGEMRINKVSRAGDQRRIDERIIRPLDQLGTAALPEASAAIGELRLGVRADVVASLPQWQDDILRRMREVLANMLEWEGYREAVALLQEIIEAQSELHGATVEALARQLEDILGLDELGDVEPDDGGGR